jgi:hypothetical protein
MEILYLLINIRGKRGEERKEERGEKRGKKGEERTERRRGEENIHVVKTKESGD